MLATGEITGEGGKLMSPQLSTDLQLDALEEEAQATQVGLLPSSAVPSVLSVIEVSDGDGKFVLTTAFSAADAPPGVTVDIVPGALRLKSGRTSRWVPLPEDALLDQAVIEQSEQALTVTIPERNRRIRRNIVHVW